MSRGKQGMQKGVQVALGISERRGPPRPHEGNCYCGLDHVIGTDNDVPVLRFNGLAFGRMVVFCPRCRNPREVFPGPKMLTREDLEGPSRAVFYGSPKAKKPRATVPPADVS